MQVLSSISRSIILVAESKLVNKMAPGSRVTIHGIYSIYTQVQLADKKYQYATLPSNPIRYAREVVKYTRPW